MYKITIKSHTIQGRELSSLDEDRLYDALIHVLRLVGLANTEVTIEKAGE